MYKKRVGTSGLPGQFYETKLLSLILFRAQHDDNIEEFYLGANLEKADYFDDICFKAKIKGHDRPLVVFIQVRHRETDRSFDLNRRDIVKYFNSYLKIKENFNPRSNDLIFNENFENNECVCVLYTNAKGSFMKRAFESPIANNLNDLITTSMIEGFQLCYTDEKVQILEMELLKNEIKSLAKHFVKFIGTDRNEMMMCDEYILRYHLILASSVIHVSRVAEDHSVCTFRQEFFDTEDKYLSLLREELYQHACELFHSTDALQQIKDSHVNEFLSNPSESTLINVIGSVITYKNYELKFVTKVPDNLKLQLSLINLPHSTINLAILNKLRSLSFKVPSAFGNKDLIIRGSPNKIKKRLDYLTVFLVNLIHKSKPSNIISIDETLPDGFLRLSGGLGGAIGNLLVYDYDKKLFRFSENKSVLEPNARYIITKLENEIHDFGKYMFQINIPNFPKLSIYDHSYKYSVNKFLDNFVIWTDQACNNILDLIFKREIENYETHTKTDYFRIKSDAIFLKYHDNILKWWMSPHAQYLTKDANIYQLTVNGIFSNPLIQITSMMFMKDIPTTEYSFNEDALKIFTDNFSGTIDTILVANITMLTVIKVIQYLRQIIKHEPIVLDLKYIFNMLTDEFYAIISELENTDKQDILILVCDDFKSIPPSNMKLKKFIKATSDKHVIIITNTTDVAVMTQCFPQICKVISDEKHSLEDLQLTSRKTILKNAQVAFQGQDVTLDLLVYDFPMKFIQGSILRKVILKEKIVVGGSLANSNYDKMKHLFIDRKVNRNQRSFELRTLFDITDDVILITGKPGIGKSTLLTHLALRTKELEPICWILNIHFVECIKYFNNWHKRKTDIDTLEMLKFMCRIVLQITRPGHNAIISLHINSNGEIYLEDLEEDNEWATFELRLFLHFYIRSKIVFIFDGFDEIFPHYRETVMDFLNVIKNDPHKNKMWITSRVYEDIDSFERLGTMYELQGFNDNDLYLYLDKFWKTNIILSKFEKEHLEVLEEFLNETSAKNFTSTLNPLGSIYMSLILYLVKNFPGIDGRDKWRDLYNTSTLILKDNSVAKEGHSSVCANNTPDIKTPLMTYLSAKYCANHVNHLETNSNKSLSSEVSPLTIYEAHIKTKLLEHFIDNKKVDIYNPIIRKEYDEEFKKLMSLYDS